MPIVKSIHLVKGFIYNQAVFTSLGITTSRKHLRTINITYITIHHLIVNCERNLHK